MLKSIFDLRSLPAQMIFGFVVVVFLTTSTIGVPSILLLRQQLDRQAWTLVGQGENAAEAFCAAQQREIYGFATLIAERPMLPQLLQQGKLGELASYMLVLQNAASFDLITVCDTMDQMMASTDETIPKSICTDNHTGGIYVINNAKPTEVMMTAIYPIHLDQAATGHVIVGIRMDHAYATQMRAYSGLENTILLNQRPIASSFDVELSTLANLPRQVVAPKPSSDVVRSRFDLQGQPYYAGNLPLKCLGVNVEVALPVADIVHTQKRLVWLLVGEMLVVAGLGSVVGIFVSRRISQPLVNLAAAASGLSRGDLNSPVVVEANMREQTQLAQALESARVNLLQTLTDLRREKAWTNHLLESIVEGIITLDEKMCITFFSHGAERITGWQRDQVLNHSCDDVFKLEEAGLLFSQVIPSPGMSKKILVRFAGERLATISLTSAHLSLPFASEAQFAIVFRDITEEDLIHHLLGQFIANVVHEFRTPLAALNASIELLLEQQPQASPAESLGLIKGLQVSVLNLQSLVDNLLESASFEAGHFHVSPRPYDLGDLIYEAVRTMRPLLEKYNQRLLVEIPETLPLVNADPRRTVQVLVNLLGNASKYGPVDTEIILNANLENGWVRVNVVDLGPGVPPEQRDSLFRRFARPGTAQAHIKVGAGLGLSVVKAVVEAQGGKAGVDYPPSGGTIFWFTIPMAQEI